MLNLMPHEETRRPMTYSAPYRDAGRTRRVPFARREREHTLALDPLSEDFAEAARDTAALIRSCEDRATAAMLVEELAAVDARPAYRAALRTALA